MINLKAFETRAAALDYFLENVGSDKNLCVALNNFVTRSSETFASFKIRSKEEIELGRGRNNFLNDVFSCFSQIKDSEIFVLDTWMSLSDNKEVDLVEEYLPDIVFKVGNSNDINRVQIERTLLKCSSFTTVWFSVNRTGQVSSCAISAFDQEGCIYWR